MPLPDEHYLTSLSLSPLLSQVHAERLKLRRLTNERLKQEAAVPLMLDAIRNREYRRCVYFAQECGVSIDMETPQGGTFTPFRG